MDEGIDVTIVGAGMAGLAAGRELLRRGWSVQLIDKGRGVGGRMATRRFAGGRYDTGAQFFSARSAPLRRLLEETLLPKGVARIWYERGGEPYYRGAEGMTSIPKEFARELHVETATRVTTLTAEEGAWSLRFENQAGGADFRSRALLLTPPVPQTMELLAPHRERIDSSLWDLLDSIRYEPNLALLLSLVGESPLSPPGYERTGRSEELYWVADNRVKGISPESTGPALTVHAAPGFSQKHYDAPEEETYEKLLARFLEAYPSQPRGSGYEVREGQLKKWRYAKPVNPAPERSYLLFDGAGPPAAVAGDAFGGPRVEGAYLSGLEAAHLLDGVLRR